MASSMDGLVLETKKEIENGTGHAGEMAKHAESLSAKDRASFILELKRMIRKSILCSRENPVLVCRKWRRLESVLKHSLSALNIEPNRNKKEKSMIVQKLVRRALLAYARREKDAIMDSLLHKVSLTFSAAVDPGSEHAPGSAEISDLAPTDISTEFRVLKKIGGEEEARESMLRAYVENAKKNQRSEENPAAYCKRMVSLPGISFFVPGTPLDLKKEIKNRTADVLLSDTQIAVDDLLQLLSPAGAAVISRIYGLCLSRKHRRWISGRLCLAITKKIEPFPFRDSVIIEGLGWNKGMLEEVRRACRRALSKHVQDHPEKHSNILVLRMQQRIEETETRETQEKRALKTISKNVSDTPYFEELIVSMVVHLALKGVQAKKIKKRLSLISSTWSLQLKRRVGDVLKDIASSKPYRNSNVYITHANAFRWPAEMKAHDLPSMPPGLEHLAKIKRAIASKKKKDRVVVEWVDHYSTLEIEVGKTTAVISLLQYWIITEVQRKGEVPAEYLETASPVALSHLEPLIHKEILDRKKTNQEKKITADAPGPGSDIVTVGKSFQIDHVWRDLLPMYTVPQEEAKSRPLHYLAGLFIDSYVTRTLKKEKRKEKEEVLRKLAGTYGHSPNVSEKRISALVARGLVTENEGYLEYLP